MEWDIFPQTGSSRHDKQVPSFIYLYGIKAKPNLFVISLTRILFTKGKEGGEWYESKQIPHTFNKWSFNKAIKLLTFSGHFLSFEDLKKLWNWNCTAFRGTPIARQTFYMEKKKLQIRAVRGDWLLKTELHFENINIPLVASKT